MFFSCEEAIYSNVETPILAIGDLYFDYNTEDEESIPAFTGRALGVSVQNNAIGGTRVSSGDPYSDIPSQYEEGDWSWVLVNGGGNDLNEECGCGDCEENINGIISEDGQSGDMVSLIEKIVEDGSRVAWVGYYNIPEDAPDFF